VDQERLAVRVVALATDDRAGGEAPVLEIAEGEVPVELEPDGGQATPLGTPGL
jgi:hypothetical protein